MAKRPDKTGTPIMVRMQDAQLRSLDSWIALRSRGSSRPEAVRQIIHERVAQMTHVRFIEGTFEDGMTIHDAVMDTVPPIDAVLQFVIDRTNVERFKVTGWRYQFEVDTKTLGLSDDLKHVAVLMKRL